MVKVSFHNEINEKMPIKFSNVDKKRYCNVDIKRKNCFFYRGILQISMQ